MFASSFDAVSSPPISSTAGGSWPLPTSSPAPNAAPAERVTIPGVEIARVGSFEASTGPATFTADDFASAVAALAAGVIHRPVLKLGHEDPRFDGAPSVGWVDHLRINGPVLVGDLAGVPRWLADAMPTSWPNRSLEGVVGYTDADGRVWPFVLTGLALLGATAPAIGNLAELREFVAASRGTRTAQSAVTAAKARRTRRARNII
ncbi:hypothetical protein O4159_08840 [Gordonia terrae]|uniref:hypothetical protein n=1 Tax=Gordonia hongkongensis TaxID=1701090 RepID=UPI0022B48A56|nr:hypothetical protein [Gordonia terrae]